LSSLDLTDWSTLQHAYGQADDIPPLLHRLSLDPTPKNPNDEPWFSLWSALRHQGDVYSASYVAVPQIVRIGLTVRGPIDSGFFMLPACIEIARSIGRGPTLSDAATGPYLLALRQLHDCAYAHSDDPWDSDMTQSIAAALAASKGQIELAQALVNLDRDIIYKINASDW
jgi:hypothetical protein